MENINIYEKRKCDLCNSNNGNSHQNVSGFNLPISDCNTSSTNLLSAKEINNKKQFFNHPRSAISMKLISRENKFVERSKSSVIPCSRCTNQNIYLQKNKQRLQSTQNFQGDYENTCRHSDYLVFIDEYNNTLSVVQKEDKEIELMKDELQQYNQTILKAQVKIQETENIIQYLKKEEKQRNDHVLLLNVKLKHLQTYVQEISDTFKCNLADKNSIIDQLQESVNGLEKKINELQEYESILTNDINQMQMIISSFYEQIKVSPSYLCKYCKEKQTVKEELCSALFPSEETGQNEENSSTKIDKKCSINTEIKETIVNLETFCKDLVNERMSIIKENNWVLNYLNQTDKIIQELLKERRKLLIEFSKVSGSLDGRDQYIEFLEKYIDLTDERQKYLISKLKNLLHEKNHSNDVPINVDNGLNHKFCSYKCEKVFQRNKSFKLESERCKKTSRSCSSESSEENI